MCVWGSQAPLPDLPLEVSPSLAPSRGGQATVHGPQDRGAVSGAVSSLSWCLRVTGSLAIWTVCPVRTQAGGTPHRNPTCQLVQRSSSRPRLPSGRSEKRLSRRAGRRARKAGGSPYCYSANSASWAYLRPRGNAGGGGRRGEAVRSFSPQRTGFVTHMQRVIQLHSSVRSARKGACKPFHLQL